MIDNFSFLLAEFDLRGFVAAFLEITQAWDSGGFVSKLESIHDTPLPNYDEDRDLYAELVKDGFMLFFSVHECLVDGAVRCVDGSVHKVRKFDIGISDAYGLLVEVRDGWVNLYPALYDGSSHVFPSIQLQSTCSCVEEAMTKFVEMFARPSDKPATN